MEHHSEPEGYFGQSVQRREDPRLLRGESVFVADVRLLGVAHMAVLRSPHAHARVVRVDVSRALEVPGVIAAFGAADLGTGIPKMPLAVPHRNLRPQLSSPLAADATRKPSFSRNRRRRSRITRSSSTTSTILPLSATGMGSTKAGMSPPTVTTSA